MGDLRAHDSAREEPGPNSCAQLAPAEKRRAPQTIDQARLAVRRMLEGMKTGMRVDYELDWKKVAPRVCDSSEFHSSR